MKESQAASLHAQLQHGMSVTTLIDEAYLRCLSRYPTSDERERFAAILNEASDADKRTVVEDLFWALMTSREFVFNH